MGGTITWEGRDIPVEPGQTVAAALWAAGIRSWRHTRLRAAPRGLFCGIGACYDCLATIDGVPGQRACLVPARPGSVVSAEPLGTAPPAPPGPGPRRYDLIVVGAGPAGMAAAATAGLAGLRVALLDPAPRLGGQYWRHRSTVERDRKVFEGLRGLIEERVDHVPGATVWFAETGRVHTTEGRFDAPRIVVATGAYDRALPFPGWDLLGVVTPGAAQALLKGSGVAIGRTAVVAGAGPFLLPVAVGLLKAGVRVAAVVEAGDPVPYLRHAPALFGAAGKLGEAASYAAVLARRRVPYLLRHAVTAATGDSGDSGLSSVEVSRLDRHGRPTGTGRRIECDAAAVGYGFTAQLELAMALGCDVMSTVDGGLAVAVDEDGRTSTEGVYAAGEVTGVGGAGLAVVTGRLAGAAAALDAGQGGLPARELGYLRHKRRRLTRFAAAMHEAHRVPAGWVDWLAGDTLVCRCEEVPYSRVAEAVRDLGATDARTVKALSRTGMGWCQGRVCGFATAGLTAHLCGRAVSPADLIPFAQRPFASPVALATLAADE